jgi:hypothetical protein
LTLFIMACFLVPDCYLTYRLASNLGYCSKLWLACLLKRLLHMTERLAYAFGLYTSFNG